MNIEDLEVMESVQEEEVDMYKVFSDLVSIGNRAKDIARYDIANDAFAVALDAYFDIQDKDGDENGPPPAWLEWETQDEAGDYPPEVYYDLLDICTPPRSGSCGKALYLSASTESIRGHFGVESGYAG